MAIVYNPFTDTMQFLNPSGSGVNVVTSDPASPMVDEVWLLKQGNAGYAMGVLGLTYSGGESYYLSVKGATGVFRVRLR